MNASSSPKITKAEEIPGFGCSRYAPVQFLPEATKFSEDALLSDPVQIVRLLRRFPQIIRELDEATQPIYTGGRHRMRGSWALVFLAYMLTGLGDMDRFHKRWASSGLWKAAGFKHAPSSPTLYLRFVELEEHREAFEEAAHSLMRRARRHQPLVGRAVHVDGTGISTHAALEHFCPPGSSCKKAGKAARAQRIGDDLVGDIRAQESERPEDTVDSKPGNALQRLDDAEVKRLGLDKILWGPNKDRSFAWFKQANHYFRLRDTTASPRMYGGGAGRKKRFWNGWNDITVTDAFTGAPLAIEVTDAREQEWAVYPGAMTKTHQALGVWRRLASADRGFVTKDTYEFNTHRGIGSAFPWREPHTGTRRRHLESEEFDRHGIVRCEHCGSPCDIRGAGLGFYFDRKADGTEEPRIRARCRLQGTDDCNETQSIACARVAIPAAAVPDRRGVPPAHPLAPEHRARPSAPARPLHAGRQGDRHAEQAPGHRVPAPARRGHPLPGVVPALPAPRLARLPQEAQRERAGAAQPWQAPAEGLRGPQALGHRPPVRGGRPPRRARTPRATGARLAQAQEAQVGQATTSQQQPKRRSWPLRRLGASARPGSV